MAVVEGWQVVVNSTVVNYIQWIWENNLDHYFYLDCYLAVV